ncbi:MAG: hypothetical protein ABJH98_04040 [Reichenbachiella sp.]|uniref:hypothetical protein n=1 Tax=Reichenbachiella sp. TaxID=2184521 RepID=UPI0032983927
MDTQSTISNCKVQIERLLEWGTSDQWQNQEFEELSQIIFNKTGVSLSHTTLKRVWGKVNYASQPSISTLDALANFLDYPSWSAYKRAQDSSRTSKKFQIPNILTKRVVTILSLIILVSFSSWYIITSNLSNPKALTANLNFKASYASHGLPNTVIYSFNANEIEAEQLVIQQSWDKSKRIKINQNQTAATSVFYYPGYFRSKFVADEVVLKEADVYIETDGWLGTINSEPVPVYLEEGDLIKKGKLSLSDEGIAQLNKLNQPVSFHYYTTEKSISGDDFSFETSIRYAQVNQASACKYAKVVIHFSEGAFLIPFAIPGCIGEINVLAMDQYISGIENDLSAFGLSLANWQQIDITSKNKKLNVSVGNQKIFSTSFSKDPGYLVGVSYLFDGIGEVDHLSITNGKVKWQFDEQF